MKPLINENPGNELKFSLLFKPLINENPGNEICDYFLNFVSFPNNILKNDPIELCNDIVCNFNRSRKIN